jgi:5-methylcytosine-specific restriction endonuclease McrA
VPILTACHDCGRPTSVGIYCDACLPAATEREKGRWRPLRNQPKIRREILERDHGVCYFCGLAGATDVHHIVPWSRGGTDEPANLAAAHADCNKRAGAKGPIR